MTESSVPQETDALQIASVKRVVAVIVGVEHYQERTGKIDGVPFAIADATAFRDTLAEIFGEGLEAMLLTDSQATLSSLKYDLDRAISSLTESDLFVFYFAGHGFHGAMGNYFAVFDTVLGNISGTGLSLRESIVDKLAKSECDRALIFVDACARPFEGGAGRDGLSDLNEEELAEFLNATKYCAVYLSCKPGQASYPSTTLKHGIWTHFVLQALRGVDDDAMTPDGILTDVSLRDYLKRSVPRYIRDNMTINQHQEPYALIEASASFRIPSVPKLTRVVSESSNLSAIGGKIRREYLEDIERGGTKRLPGFVSSWNTVPKRHTSSTHAFVEGLLETKIREIVQRTYTAVKSEFNLKRADISRNEGGAVGTLDTEFFRFEIRGEQDPDEASDYRVTRTLELRRYNEDTADTFDEVFGTFDSAVIEFDATGLNFEAVVEYLETLADDHGGRTVDDEGSVIYKTPTGDTIEIDFESERIVFSIPGVSLPSTIVERLSAYKFGLTGKSQLMLRS